MTTAEQIAALVAHLEATGWTHVDNLRGGKFYSNGVREVFVPALDKLDTEIRIRQSILSLIDEPTTDELLRILVERGGVKT